MRAESGEADVRQWHQQVEVLRLEVARLKLELKVVSPQSMSIPTDTVRAQPSLLTQRILEYTQTHYHHPMSLGDIAAAFGLSVSHLSTVFHRAAGIRFHDYLDLLRLRRAIGLLGEPGCTIAEVAAKAGYASDTWFRHAFKRHTGLSPSAWRVLHAGAGPRS